MDPFALKLLPSEEVVLFRKIERVINLLPAINLGTEDGEEIYLSCHMLARALGTVFNLQVADGHAIAYEHSWLVTKHGNILDVYPIATIGGPLLIDGGTLYARQIYKRCTAKEISSGCFGKPWFRNSVRKIERQIRKILFCFKS